MLSELLKLLKGKGDLLEISKNKSLAMLNTSREMVSLVFNTLEKNSYKKVKASISKIDKTINEMQKEVNKMIIEHLAISGVKDLIKSLQLFSIVDDIERIGDNAKNLADVLDYLPDELIISDSFTERFTDVVVETDLLFSLTVETITDFNVSTADLVIVKYQNISRVCEGIIREIVTSESNNVNKADVRLLLLMRYTKRINAHLRNISQIVKEPINLSISK